MAESDGKEENPDYPGEIVPELRAFHEALRKAEGKLFPLMAFKINSSDVKLSPLDKASLHVICAYAINAFFWMYLKTQGMNVTEHKIMDEMERIKGHMKSLKEAEDKMKAPRLNREAAARFVQSSLWTPRENNPDDDAVGSTTHEHKTAKRKSDEHRSNKKKKKF